MSEKEEIEGEHEERKMACDGGKNTKYAHLKSSNLHSHDSSLKTILNEAKLFHQHKYVGLFFPPHKSSASLPEIN